MPRVCSICFHNQRNEIERMMRNPNKGYRTIATRFNVSTSALSRHQLRCLDTVTGQNEHNGTVETKRDSVPLRSSQGANDTRNPIEQLQEAIDYQARAEVQSPIVTMRTVEGHLQHVVSFPEFDVSVAPETPMAVLKQGLPYLRRAIQLAGDDRLEQERLVAVLNEALQADDMGLP